MAALTYRYSHSGGSGVTSPLLLMQARLREQLMLEKESRLLDLAARQEAARQDTFQRVMGSSGSSLSSSLSSLNGNGHGRVRKMFEERRTNKGYDKSYPLEPVTPRQGGRHPVKGVMRGQRGISVDRGLGQYASGPIKRTKSQVAIPRVNRGGDQRQVVKSPPRARPAHYKSASSLLENGHAHNGYSYDSDQAVSSRSRYNQRPSPSPSPSQTPPHKSVPPRPPPRPARRPKDSKVGGFVTGYRAATPSEDESQHSVPSSRNSNNASPPQTLFSNDPNDPDNMPLPTTKGKKKLPPKLSQASSLAPSPSKPGFAPPGENQAACSICGRVFNKDRIEKHEVICRTNQMKAKKRKQFDPVKMRTKGTEAEKFVARGEHLKESPKGKKADWRKKHEDFIKTVRAAKGMKGYDEAPPIDTSDYVECPHCGRKFSEAAAERHIPKCSNIKSNKNLNGPRGR